MSAVSQWVGRTALNWFEGFRRRYGLGASAKNPSPNKVLPPLTLGQKALLHVGCGPVTMERIALPGFQTVGWREFRFDADASVSPDIVGTMTDMSAVSDGFADAIYSSHNIEHLYPHEVAIALAEFHRVLKPAGFLVVTCPDLQSVCRLIVEDKLDHAAYDSPAGPIAPLDMLYGHRPQMEAGNLYMAHHSGFTLSTLRAALTQAGFSIVKGLQRENTFDLWALASKMPLSPEENTALTANYLVPES